MGHLEADFGEGDVTQQKSPKKVTLTCSHASFSFLPPLLATPLPPLFSAHFRPFLPLENCWSRAHSAELGEGQIRDGPLHKVWEGNSWPKSA